MAARVRYRLAILLLAALAAAPGAVTAAADDLSRERVDYVDAVQALNRGRLSEYRQLRPALEDYPLAIYLDYYQLAGQGAHARTADAVDFLERSAGSPLPNRFLGQYLRQLGKRERWRDFLQVMPREPNDIRLKCYYFRAQQAAGNHETAWEGAARLWVSGTSQPQECDPLFAAWMAADRLTDDIVWTRLLNAFEARQGSLLTYVARKGSDRLRPHSDTLLAVYHKPASLLGQNLSADDRYAADIATAGLAYLARYNPEQAHDGWETLQARLQFSEEQARQVESAIALQALFAQSESLVPWLQDVLARLDDDKLVEIRLRWALAEQDWQALAATLPLLSEEGARKDTWRYWRARLLERDGDSDGARALLTELAGERSYYGFLAADRIGMPYAFQQVALPAAEDVPLAELNVLPAVRRVEELDFHDEPILAHSEWYTLLQATEPEQARDLGQLALARGWYRMSIDAATRAEAWDVLDLRFPTPFRDEFAAHASARGVPETELMSIARRESAFFPLARSPVGAQGLMQVMPATAKEVASSLGRSHSDADLYRVDYNVQLGSTYYRQMLDRFGGNRIFALTAYNAGPHRVQRWRHKEDEGVPVEVWVETIPYRETREYVQAVLSYNVVFGYMIGDTRPLLTEQERLASY